MTARIRALLFVVCAALAAPTFAKYPGGLPEAFGARYRPVPIDSLHEAKPALPPNSTVARLVRWNRAVLDADALDHTPPQSNETRIYGEQFGPTRASRAFAIVHLAVFDAVNAIARRYRSYSGINPAPADSSLDAAIAQAAHDALVALYPSQSARLKLLLAQDLAQIPDHGAKWNGVDAGRRAAAAILAMRADDGYAASDPLLGVEYVTSDAPGVWRIDPVSMIPIAHGAYWPRVKPFILDSLDRYRLRPPPPLPSIEYARAYGEVKLLGGDGVHTSTVRAAPQTIAGIFWSYDGTPYIGTPPRLYNQIAVQIAAQRATPAIELARLLALVNVAIADAGLATWDNKYRYLFWRPVTAIREADPGTGPTGLGDGNPGTRGDPGFTPLGAQASNLSGPDFTPPFPAYPSGHAAFGSAMFQILRRFYGTDVIPFAFVSDEFNGKTRDNSGAVRPRIERRFATLSMAEEENGQSRIYLGIHWAFDKTEGQSLGRRVADEVFTKALAPATSK